LCSLLAPSFGLEDWVFGSIDATLPKAMSDHSAARSPDNGVIYLGGGCGTSVMLCANTYLLRYLTFSCFRQ
jgi:hypothetical protein